MTYFTTFLIGFCILLAALLALVVYRLYQMWRDYQILEDEWKDQKSTIEAQERALEKAATVNRKANKYAQAEARDLRAQLGSARRHAAEIQEFHLHNNLELQHELASTHALIDVLMATFPKEYSITSVPFEVQRAFRPVIEQFNPKVDKDNPLSTSKSIF